VLSNRQPRWVEILPSYDITIEHLEGKLNPAEGPCRQPDYEEGYERPTTQLLATLAVTTVELYDDLLHSSTVAQASDLLAVNE